MKVATTIPAGAVFTITTGAYSDYIISGVFSAVTDIQPYTLLTQWLADHPEQRESYHFDETEFMAWLTREGMLKPVHSFEWHLHDYSGPNEMTLHESEE